MLGWGPVEWIASIAILFTLCVMPIWMASRGNTGEARFGPDGEQLPTHPPEPEKTPTRVTVTQSEKIDE